MDLHVFPIDQLSIFYFLGKIHKKEKMVNNMFLFSSSLPTFITFDSEKNILKKQQKKKPSWEIYGTHLAEWSLLMMMKYIITSPSLFLIALLSNISSSNTKDGMKIWLVCCISH